MFMYQIFLLGISRISFLRLNNAAPSVSIMEYSLNGFRAWLALKKFVDFIKSEAVEVISKKSYVKAEAYLIGNKIEYYGNNVTETCKQFLDVVQEDEAYLGWTNVK
ncbi:Uncharacterised protein [Streptococcus pseudoporcinus]|uniref:Uncharacterized protein n=1 Tax=Streptococcus pseudoporcinus TaxID=361101 RepID=A0A4U9Z496_9STRE|nr:Uncharacterised protein [Streptococcus pseudoporcinus]